jgi:hypothetical protein
MLDRGADGKAKILGSHAQQCAREAKLQRRAPCEVSKADVVAAQSRHARSVCAKLHATLAGAYARRCWRLRNTLNL